MNATRTKPSAATKPPVPARNSSGSKSPLQFVYRIAAWLSGVLFLLFTGTGIDRAFRTEGRPPRVNLSYVTDINKLLSANTNGSYAQAISQMRMAIAIDPGARQTLLEAMNKVAISRGDTDSQVFAARELAKSPMTQPTPELYSDLSSALLDLQNRRRSADEIAESIYWSQQAIRIDPNFAKAYGNLGAAFALRSQFADAADCFRKACTLDPNLEPARLGLAYVEQQLKNSGKSAQ